MVRKSFLEARARRMLNLRFYRVGKVEIRRDKRSKCKEERRIDIAKKFKTKSRIKKVRDPVLDKFDHLYTRYLLHTR